MSQSPELKTSAHPLDLPGAILRSALGVSAIVAPLVSLQIVLVELIAGSVPPRTIALSLYPLAFPLLWMLQKRLGRRRTGFIYLALMLLMAFLLQLRGGLSFAQAVVQLWVLLLAGLIFGVRGVAVGLALSLLGFLTAAYLVLNGFVPAVDVSIVHAEQLAPPRTQNLAQCGWFRVTSRSASASVSPNSNCGS